MSMIRDVLLKITGRERPPAGVASATMLDPSPHVYVFESRCAIRIRTGPNKSSPFYGTPTFGEVAVVDYHYRYGSTEEISEATLARVNRALCTSVDRDIDPEEHVMPGIRSFSIRIIRRPKTQRRSGFWAVTKAVSDGELSPEQIDWLAQKIVGQFGDGWGEGLEQRDIVPGYVLVLSPPPSYKAAGGKIRLVAKIRRR